MDNKKNNSEYSKIKINNIKKDLKNTNEYDSFLKPTLNENILNQIRNTTNILNTKTNDILNKNFNGMRTASLAIQQANEAIDYNRRLINNIPQMNEVLNQVHTAHKIFQNINMNQILNQYASIIRYTSLLEQYFLDHETQINFCAEIESILDEELGDDIKKIFHIRFLNRLIVSEKLWILPRITKQEYVKLSKINLDENSISETIFKDYINQPESINEIITNWKLDYQRKKIINQIYENYLLENYETVIIMLTTQIEGIFLDKMDLEKIFNSETVNYVKSSELRKELEKQINDSLKKTDNKWELFIKKCNVKFLLYILKPLYARIDFVNEDKINRNQMLHKGIINLEKENEINQIIAIRFFLILDTLIFMFENLNKI